MASSMLGKHAITQLHPNSMEFSEARLGLHVLSESLIYATDKTRVFRAYHNIIESTLFQQEEASDGGNDLKLTLKTPECMKNPPVGGSELKDT